MPNVFAHKKAGQSMARWMLADWPVNLVGVATAFIVAVQGSSALAAPPTPGPLPPAPPRPKLEAVQPVPESLGPPPGFKIVPVEEPARLLTAPGAKPRKAMTLQEALEYSAVHQPSLVAARARLTAAVSSAQVPRALYLPRVAGTAQIFEGTANNSTASYVATYGLDLPRIGATAVGTSNWGPSASTLAGIGLRQEIYDFGRIAALESVADWNTEAERGLTDAVRLDVAYAVESGYDAVQTAKGVLAAAQSALDRSKFNYDTAVAGVRVGLRDPIELTRAEADLARFGVARVRAEAALAVSQGVFAAVVGVPDAMLDAVGQPPPPAPSPSLDDAMSLAMKNDPMLRERRARIREQRANTSAIAAELRPDISLTTSISGRAGDALPTAGTNGSGAGLIPNVPNWDGGLVFTWPLLDFAVRAREQASQALEGAREAELADQRQRLIAAVQKAYLDMLAADRALPALEQTLVAARANYAQAEARFKNELGTSVELADAQALLASAEVDVTIGRFELLRARAGLKRVIAEGL